MIIKDRGSQGKLGKEMQPPVRIGKKLPGNWIKPKIVILSHISEQNNSPETALCEVEEYLAQTGLQEYPFFVIVDPTTRSTIINQ